LQLEFISPPSSPVTIKQEKIWQGVAPVAAWTITFEFA